MPSGIVPSENERRKSKSDSETSDLAPGSLDWCSSVGPLNWADEVEAALTDSGDEITTPRTGNDASKNTQNTGSHRFTSVKKEMPLKNHHVMSPVKAGHTHYSWADGCAGAVIELLQRQGSGRMAGSLGWEALHSIWNVGPSNLDSAVLSCLNTKPLRSQEHILLSFAAIDLSNVKNLSAYLNCLVKEHDTTRQVCLYFLAGLCTEEKGCTWVHPVNTRGWDTLRDKWQITFKDLDYTVLNFLCKKTTEEQDNILASLAALDLRSIHNLSAYLSSMIQKHGGNHSPSSRKGDGRRTYAGRHVHRALSPDLSPELLLRQESTPNHEVGSLGISPQYFSLPFHPCIGAAMVPYRAPYMMQPYDEYLNDGRRSEG
eukprot:GGOE01053331.1.p1 GENE.GGOE01053331.1~~GGOE01053331.1.p1  ORF type:complete len:372 (-),score=19.53 GGOE01053331.1:119-1234(-)